MNTTTLPHVINNRQPEIVHIEKRLSLIDFLGWMPSRVEMEHVRTLVASRLQFEQKKLEAEYFLYLIELEGELPTNDAGQLTGMIVIKQTATPRCLTTWGSQLKRGQAYWNALCDSEGELYDQADKAYWDDL